MAVHERLSIEEVSAETLIASEHVHRYEFAASQCVDRRVVDLCCGSGYGSLILQGDAQSVVGVDVDVATIEAARRMDSPIDFVAADAVDYLRTATVSTIDAVVCFEGLEHVPNLDQVVEELARLASQGVRLLLTVPNSEMWDEVNEFHRTDFSYDSAAELFRRVGAEIVLVQQLAEGSVIADPAQSRAVGPVQVRWPERIEPEYANHFLGVANGDMGALSAALSGKLAATSAPTYNRHIRNIERANLELWRTNARLGREAYAHAGSGAAVRTRRVERELQERTATLRARVAELEAELKSSQDARRSIEAMLGEYIEQAQHRANRPARRVAAIGVRAAARVARALRSR